jgi:nucleoside-diphosphate-sugar epimerase
LAKIVLTGVAGCIGAWTARHLLEEGHEVVGADLSPERHRFEMLGIDGAFPVTMLDIADRAAVERLLLEHRPDAVVHLAGMLVPACRANPVLACEINVLAFIHLLEMSRRHGFYLSYASSAAVFGADRGRPLREDEGLRPETLYGVFKRGDEEIARLYAQDYGVASAGLRPNIVYGPGRDGGMSADVSVALWHASRKEPFHIRFGGTLLLEHAEEVARMFALTALNPRQGAGVYNLPGVVASVPQIVRTIEDLTGNSGLITHDAPAMAIAWNQDASAFERDYGQFSCMDVRAGFQRALDVWRQAATRGGSPHP